jgi:hypothetical protein
VSCAGMCNTFDANFYYSGDGDLQECYCDRTCVETLDCCPDRHEVCEFCERCPVGKCDKESNEGGLDTCKVFSDGYHCKVPSKESVPDRFSNTYFENAAPGKVQHYYLVDDLGTPCLGPGWTTTTSTVTTTTPITPDCERCPVGKCDLTDPDAHPEGVAECVYFNTDGYHCEVDGQDQVPAQFVGKYFKLFCGQAGGCRHFFSVKDVNATCYEETTTRKPRTKRTTTGLTTITQKSTKTTLRTTTTQSTSTAEQTIGPEVTTTSDLLTTSMSTRPDVGCVALDGVENMGLVIELVDRICQQFAENMCGTDKATNPGAREELYFASSLSHLLSSISATCRRCLCLCPMSTPLMLTTTMVSLTICLRKSGRHFHRLTRAPVTVSGQEMPRPRCLQRPRLIPPPLVPQQRSRTLLPSYLPLIFPLKLQRQLKLLTQVLGPPLKIRQ